MDMLRRETVIRGKAAPAISRNVFCRDRQTGQKRQKDGQIYAHIDVPMESI